MRRMIVLLAALLLWLPLCASAQDTPEWDYPLAPEILSDSQQYITLTNRSALLDANYEPEDLETLSMRTVVKGQLRKEANAALKAMFDAAGEAGYTLYVKSAYRNYRTQKTMYYNWISLAGTTGWWLIRARAIIRPGSAWTFLIMNGRRRTA